MTSQILRRYYQFPMWPKYCRKWRKNYYLKLQLFPDDRPTLKSISIPEFKPFFEPFLLTIHSHEYLLIETFQLKISSTTTLLSCKDKVSWKFQVTLTSSRLPLVMNCHHKTPKVGSTRELPLSPDTSTWESKLVSVSWTSCTVVPRTEVSDHTSTSTLPVPSTERFCNPWKSWVSSKSLQRVVEESLTTVWEIWTVSPLPLWKTKNKLGQFVKLNNKNIIFFYIIILPLQMTNL